MALDGFSWVPASICHDGHNFGIFFTMTQFHINYGVEGPVSLDYRVDQCLMDAGLMDRY